VLRRVRELSVNLDKNYFTYSRIVKWQLISNWANCPRIINHSQRGLKFEFSCIFQELFLFINRNYLF